MSNVKLLRTILRLKSLKVTHVRFMHRDTELRLAVKPYKNGCRCPACGRRGQMGTKKRPRLECRAGPCFGTAARACASCFDTGPTALTRVS